MTIDKFMTKNVSDLSKILNTDINDLSKFMGVDISSNNPWDISGLAAGYRANDLSFTEGQNITTWTDKSTNNNDLDTTHSSNWPVMHENEINGKKAAFFDGSEGNTVIYTNSASGHLHSSFTIAAVCQMTGNYGIGRTILQVGAYTGGRQFRATSRTDGKQQLLRAEVESIAKGDTTINTNWHIFLVTFDYSSGGCTFYLDGSSDGGGTNTTVWSSASYIFMGARKDGATAPIEEFKGYIADIWYYDHVLSSSDRSQLTSSLSSYYNL